MKRLTIVIVFILLALQFTCGNVSSSKAVVVVGQPKTICEDFDKECQMAVADLNRANCEFWTHSYRIEELIKKNAGSTKRHRLVLMTSRDPVNY